MNYQRIVYSLSIILLIIGLAMLLPLFCSLYYGETDSYALALSCGVIYLVGFLGFKKAKTEGEFLHKEVFFIVTVGWILVSIFGSIPYLLSGTFTSFADAFFETMSGFTTTGASVLTDVEALPHGLLLWRSLTHWLGGMGIIVLFVALFPSVGIGGMQMYQAEAPGGSLMKKIRPRISEMAKVLWSIYLIMTIAEIILLYIAGMPLFDAVCHTFGTVATGGFSIKNASIGYYNNAAIEWIITIFMFLSGANFALYYTIYRRKKLSVFTHNNEFKLYTLIVFTAIIFEVYSLYSISGYSIGDSIREAAFLVVSIITTTGFGTADFAQWSFLGQVILISLMFVGGCTGSTGGSIKVGRILVLIKQTKLELQRCLHPRAVLSLKIDGENVAHQNVLNVTVFFFLYIGIVLAGTILMTVVGRDLITSFTAAATCLGNIGPGLGLVGPTKNFAFLSGGEKYFLSFLMLLGRLEIYTVLVLFLPSFWRKG